ncbi:MAG: hypothetical protein ABI406_19150 [Ktedonobacteraceae bacterium]
MLSAAKHLTVRREMLRYAQHDSQHGAMKLDRVLHAHGRGSTRARGRVGAQFIAPLPRCGEQQRYA